MTNEEQATFIYWYFNEFQTDPLYLAMVDTVEDSPWHRERNVGTHTDMVVSQYMLNWDISDPACVLGALACAFHDVGKPGSKIEKYKPERGTYYAFHGHEVMSARLWEDYAVRNFKRLDELFGLVPTNITEVAFLIEMHKPWDIKKTDKLRDLSLTLLKMGDGAAGYEETFSRVVLADTFGRIADDPEGVRGKASEWVQSFITRTVGVEREMFKNGGPNWKYSIDENAPVLYVPIGASGTGKSTLYDRMDHDNLDTFSLDRMRHKLYGDDYGVAFKMSCEDKEFKNKCTSEYVAMLKEGKDIFLDNTNTSRKGRRQFLVEARRRGYWLIAILMPVELDEIVERQVTRDDKTVPVEAVVRQYMGLQLPQIGEFDSIYVFDSNLK